MGKSLIQQKRGKGSTSYSAPSFKSKGDTSYPPLAAEEERATILDIIDSPGHSSPLMKIKLGQTTALIQAPEGIRTQQVVEVGQNAQVQTGNILPLKNIPEGTPICNIEGNPGDGGKFVRSSGGNAKIISKMLNKIEVLMPSKKERSFKPECRATIGAVAGSGKKDKPLLKAGTQFYAARARNKFWPRSSGTAMNAVSHPYGGSSTKSKGQPATTSRHAPPGRKVGRIAAKRTGRKKR